METKEMIISGEIVFTNDPPKGRLPKPSRLIVKLEDCRLADASSIEICSVTIDAHTNYEEGKPLGFKMTVPNFVIGMQYEMAAVLNVGWIPDIAKQEWIRKGDYLNDTHHHLMIADSSQSEVKQDIKVIHYT